MMLPCSKIYVRKPQDDFWKLWAEKVFLILLNRFKFVHSLCKSNWTARLLTRHVTQKPIPSPSSKLRSRRRDVVTSKKLQYKGPFGARWYKFQNQFFRFVVAYWWAQGFSLSLYIYIYIFFLYIFKYIYICSIVLYPLVRPKGSVV